MRIAYLVAAIFAALVLGYAIFAAQNVRPSSTYNVVIISIDSLRADHLPTYGYGPATAPNITAYAKDAIVFENFFATSYLTPISEASVQTGQYPFTNGIINFQAPLKPGVKTLAETLHDRGWETAAFGSSQEFYRIPTVREGLSRGFDTYTISTGDTLLPWYGRSEDHLPDALAWAEGHAARKEPFYLWFNVGSVHWPYGQDEPAHFSDPEYDGFFKPPKFTSTSQPLALFNNLYGRYFEGQLYNDKQQVIASDTARDLAYVRGRYDDGILMTDRALAPLFEFLNRPGIKDNTIVILESEHGEGFGEHGYIAHYDVLDTQVHTPLIVRIPGVAPQRVEALISGVDIFPTILDFLDVRHEKLDGLSYYPFLTGSTSVPREEVYLTRTSLWERVIAADTPWLSEFVALDNSRHFHDTAIRSAKWKLIHRLSRDILAQYSWYQHLTGTTLAPLPEYELYDLVKDPLELKNVYTPENPIAIELKDKLAAWEIGVNSEAAPTTPPAKIQPYF